MGVHASTGTSDKFGGGSYRAGGKRNSGEGSGEWSTVGSQPDADQSGGGQSESTARNSEVNGRETSSVDSDNVTEAVRLDYDPEDPNRFCDLREWNKLQLVNPPAKRHQVAKDWLKFNYQQCGYGAMIYVRNSMPRVLGTAHQVDVDVLTWELVAPQAERTQALKKKRRL